MKVHRTTMRDGPKVGVGGRKIIIVTPRRSPVGSRLYDDYEGEGAREGGNKQRMSTRGSV